MWWISKTIVVITHTWNEWRTIIKRTDKYIQYICPLFHHSKYCSSSGSTIHVMNALEGIAGNGILH